MFRLKMLAFVFGCRFAFDPSKGLQNGPIACRPLAATGARDKGGHAEGGVRICICVQDKTGVAVLHVCLISVAVAAWNSTKEAGSGSFECKGEPHFCTCRISRHAFCRVCMHLKVFRIGEIQGASGTASETAAMVFKLTAGLWLLSFFAPLTATLLAALLYPERFYFLPNAHKWTADTSRVKLHDGRHLAYYFKGDISRKNIILHNHGVLSSRWLPLCTFYMHIWHLACSPSKLFFYTCTKSLSFMHARCLHAEPSIGLLYSFSSPSDMISIS